MDRVREHGRRNDRKRGKGRVLEMKRRICRLGMKVGRVCWNCKRRVALEWHHLPKYEKRFDISQAHKQGRSLRRVLDEMGKCVLLCKPCHMKETVNLAAVV